MTLMLVGSPEWKEKEEAKNRIKITGAANDAVNPHTDSMVWIAGKFIDTLTSQQLMRHIKSYDHSHVFDLIKKNYKDATEFYINNPSKKPDDYYVKLNQNYAILDYSTAKMVVKHLTGKVVDFNFIEDTERNNNDTDKE